MAVPEVIDVHVHLTRDTAQEKVVFGKSGYPDEWFGANGDRVTEWMDESGLSRLFMINYMDTNRMIDSRLARLGVTDSAEREQTHTQLKEDMVDRLQKFNAWGCELGRSEPRVVPFVCIDIGIFYETTAMMDELERCIANGAQGVKIHPGLSRFMPGDERMFPLYERVADAGLTMLSDSGSLGAGDTVFGEPVNFIPVFERFPQLKFIMAHLASAYWDQRIQIARDFQHVYFDIAGGFYSPQSAARDGHRACPLEDAPRLLRSVGTDRVLFGTDAPGSEVYPQLRSFMRLPLEDGEKEQILAGNARTLLELD